MKASELRIGNLVNYQVGTSVFQNKVTAITEKKIVISSIAVKYACLQPIPLTKEWLLKFGLFKLIDNRDKWYCEDKGVFSFHGKIHSSDYFISTNDFKIFHLCIATIDDGMESWEYLTELKYVHQLQNLVHALTNKELTYENLP